MSVLVTSISDSTSRVSRGISSFRTPEGDEGDMSVPEAWYVSRWRFWNLGLEGVAKGGTLGTNSDLACSDWIQFKILEYGPWPFIGGTSVVFSPVGCEKRMCPVLYARFSCCHCEANVMTYEAMQVLIRLGDSSGRESSSAHRRSMDSLK